MEYPSEADIPLSEPPDRVILVGQAIFGNMSEGGIALFSVYIFTVHESLDSELFLFTMAIIKTKKLALSEPETKIPPCPQSCILNLVQSLKMVCPLWKRL
jgi:hypothetical protein